MKINFAALLKSLQFAPTEANGLAIISVNYLKNNAALKTYFWGSI